MTTSIPAQKSEIRARLKNWKPTAENQKTILQVLQSFFLGKTGIWGCFWALSNEVSLQSLYDKMTNIQWAFPKVEGEELHYYIPGPQGFRTGALGVQEPVSQGARAVAIPDLDAVLIPGLAFDLEGTRLGRGKGYYDKNFKQFNKQTYGVAVHDQVFQSLPREDFDLRVKHLITDRGILHF